MQRFVAKSFSAFQKICVLLLTLGIAGAAVVYAQTAPAAATAPSSAGPSDPLELGRETPRGTVIGFIRAAQSENYGVAVQYFDVRRASVEREQELAQELLAILNARFAGSLDSITNDPMGRQDGEPPREQVVVGGTRGLSESFPLYLVHTEVGRGVKVWLISRQTLDQVPEVYDSLRFPQLEKRLPKFLVKTRPLEMPLWQWIAIVLFAPVALLFGWLAALLLRFCSQRIRRAFGLAVQPTEPHRRFGPSAVLGAVIIHYYFVYLIGASILYREYYRNVLLILLAFAFYWAITRLTYWISLRMWNRLTSRGMYAERSLVSLTRRVLDVTIFFLIALLVFNKVFYWNLTAALAGLGIGGLAIGLGAQKTFENMMGGISILVDRAVLVGDACRIGDQRGIVEDIGLRSTKLRTEERTLVSIPNGTVATAVLENFRLRDKILFRQALRLRYDLSPDHVRYVLEQLRLVLTRHAKVEEASARVRLLKLGENAIEVEIYAYILVREYREFLAVQEELILQAMDVLESSGAAVALPTQTTMVTRDAWIDPQKAAAAQKAMEKSRDPGVPGMQRAELAADIVPPKH
ncbi:MAG TPA: mechanosensitive ion channel domain-containing protein [Candidatus Acidoferrum sp.]|nr:mechanosensitive ion channel domain-containing protein [Candidatus Acidoferrum sp.]